MWLRYLALNLTPGFSGKYSSLHGREMVEGRRPDIRFFEASRRYIEGAVQNCLPTMQGINILVISVQIRASLGGL